jgi:DNA-directed RNA polymerase specialized sigma24 family protein
MERFASAPSFDEYVVARGGHLLRTAVLLTGDHQKAEDLVQTALGKTWPHWQHITASGVGSYDA